MNFFHPIIISEIFSYGDRYIGKNFLNVGNCRLNNLKLDIIKRNHVRPKPHKKYHAKVHFVDDVFIEDVADELCNRYENIVDVDYLEELKRFYNDLTNAIIKKYPEIENNWQRGDLVILPCFYGCFYNFSLYINIFDGRIFQELVEESDHEESLIPPSDFEVITEFPPNYWSVNAFEKQNSFHYHSTGVFSGVKKELFKEEYDLAALNDDDFSYYPIETENTPLRINPKKIKEKLDVSKFIQDEEANKWILGNNLEIENFESGITFNHDIVGYFIIRDLHNIYVFLRYFGSESTITDNFEINVYRLDVYPDKGEILIYDVIKIFENPENNKDFSFHKYILDKYGSYSPYLTVDNVYFIADTMLY